MQELAACGQIFSQVVPSEKQLITTTLSYDSLLFLKALPNNIAKSMKAWIIFGMVSQVHINIWKLVLIRCTKSDLVDL